MKKPLNGIQTEMTSALPDDTSGLQFKKTVSFMKMMLRLVALSVFIIRVVMDYLFFCDSALLANTRQIEYAMVILWAGGMAAYAVLKMLSGKDSAVSSVLSIVSCWGSLCGGSSPAYRWALPTRGIGWRQTGMPWRIWQCPSWFFSRCRCFLMMRNP